MADNKLEKSMPEFWKKVGTKVFEITGALSLALFIVIHGEINGLRSQVTELNRASQALVARDEAQRRDEQRDVKYQAVKELVDKNLQQWRDQTLHIEQGVEALEDNRDRTALPALSASTVALLGPSLGGGPLPAAAALVPGRTDRSLAKIRNDLDDLGLRILKLESRQ